MSGAGEPLVSVVLPVHDGERYLAAAIDSVLGQTHRNLELIVLDDGSTDRSAAIAESFDDPRVVRVRNERNLGLVPTLNRGLGLARGEFIARMDADDVAEPTRLARQLERFTADASLVALGTAIDYIAPKDSTLKLGFETIDQLPADEKLAIGDPGPVPAGQYAKLALEKLGKWTAIDKRLVYGGDVGQVLAYARRGEVAAAVVYATDVIGLDDVVVLERTITDAQVNVTLPPRFFEKVQ